MLPRDGPLRRLLGGNLSPWDVAAGSLIVREAGGRITDYAGREFRLDGRQVCAAGPELHPRLLEVLARHPDAHVRAAL